MANGSAVTVIIPVYNGERFLAEAIQSVLDQTLPPDEIIVVDDGSTDGSAAIATSYPRVCVLRKAHSGVAATLNHGVRHAQGDWLAFLDADDRWLPAKTALQVASLNSDPTMDMAFGHCRQFVMCGGEEEGREVVLSTQPGIGISGLLIRAAALRRIGQFNEQQDRHHFLEWYARCTDAGLRSLVLDEVLFERRVHGQNMGARLAVEQRLRYLRSLRDTLARRQREEGTV